MAQLDPLICFEAEGPDGSGKTTQLMYLMRALWSATERGSISIVASPISGKYIYWDFPEYRSPVGRTIGHCLGKWHKETGRRLPLLSPEEMAWLFAGNRRELIPAMEYFLQQQYHFFLNRGPLSNVVYGAARRVLLDNLVWEDLSLESKRVRVQEILDYDAKFFELFEKYQRTVSVVFLDVNVDRTMEMTRIRTRGPNKEPDDHEKDDRLQKLVYKIGKDIAQGGLIEWPGVKFYEVRSNPAEIEHIGNKTIDERGREEIGTAIIETGIRMGSVLCRSLGYGEQEKSAVATLISDEGPNVLRYVLEHSDPTVSWQPMAYDNGRFATDLGQIEEVWQEGRKDWEKETQGKFPRVWETFEQAQELDREILAKKETETELVSPYRGRERR